MYQPAAERVRRRGRRRATLRLSNIDWRTHTRLVHAFAEKPGVRLAYDSGELEILSPRLEHDDDRWLLGSFVHILTQVWRLPIKRGGSVTLRRNLLKNGIEADACFWIANTPKMADVRNLDLTRHPPPDLAIEVDVTHCSLDRMSIYVALGIPEVWRLEGDELTFYHLEAEGGYTERPVSLHFPTVASDDILSFLLQAREAEDENIVERKFRAWARKNKVGKSKS